jgi:5'-deoxynucleotidase YfbR-like HD superfamily hydrolase
MFKTKKKTPPRAWQRMLSGRRLDLLDPSPLDIEIEDIAQGLARVARWNGQTEGEHAFSVAEHSMVVEDICVELTEDLDAKWRLAALLHDAPEYVIGDMISPFKAALSVDYKEFEERLQIAIHVRFGLPGKLPKEVVALIKEADRAAAYIEATQLAGFGFDEAAKLFPRPKGLSLPRLTPRPAGEIQTAFLERYHALAREAGLDSGWHKDDAPVSQDAGRAGPTQDTTKDER